MYCRKHALIKALQIVCIEVTFLIARISLCITSYRRGSCLVKSDILTSVPKQDFSRTSKSLRKYRLFAAFINVCSILRTTGIRWFSNCLCNSPEVDHMPHSICYGSNLPQMNKNVVSFHLHIIEYAFFAFVTSVHQYSVP